LSSRNIFVREPVKVLLV